MFDTYFKPTFPTFNEMCTNILSNSRIESKLKDSNMSRRLFPRISTWHWTNYSTDEASRCFPPGLWMNQCLLHLKWRSDTLCFVGVQSHIKSWERWTLNRGQRSVFPDTVQGHTWVIVRKCFCFFLRKHLGNTLCALQSGEREMRRM